MIQRERLDPDVVKLLDHIAAQRRPALETLSPAEARIKSNAWAIETAGTKEAVASLHDASIPTPAGTLRVRIYTPTPESTNRPAIVYFHGGGWVTANLDTHDVPCRAIARRSGSVVVAVEYRLAPEHPFPAAVDDAYAASAWVHTHAAEIGADPKRIVVCGDSAGGTLAAVVSLKARTAGPPIALQVLVYPITNLASFDTPSYREFASGYHLSAARMEWFRSHYLSQPEQALNPLASPLLAPDLTGLPPALVITAECDVLRDEGEAYAARLEQAGVPVTLTRYTGLIHPFFANAGAIHRASDAYDQIAAAVRAL